MRGFGECVILNLMARGRSRGRGVITAGAMVSVSLFMGESSQVPIAVSSGIYSSPRGSGRIDLPSLGPWGLRLKFGWPLHGRSKSPAASTGRAAVRGPFVDNRLSRVSLLCSLVLVLFCFVLNASAQVNDYYVATTGSDSGPGQPITTLEDHHSRRQRVIAGRFGNHGSRSQGTYNECVATNRTGTANQRIRYVSDTTLGAKIVCNGGTTSAGCARGVGEWYRLEHANRRLRGHCRL